VTLPPDDDDSRHRDEDEIPRKSILSSMPKHSLSRVVVLLAALAGILYLRQKTGSIAGCMSNAFLGPASPTVPTIRATVQVPDGGAATAPRRDHE
jgi:hypothetical protein